MADFFAQLNNKMGGDLKKIQIVGEYMVEIWKAVGMDMARVEVLSNHPSAKCPLAEDKIIDAARDRLIPSACVAH